MKNILTIQGQLYSSKNHRRVFRNKYTGKTVNTKSAVATTNESDLIKLLSDAKLKKEWFKLIENKTPPYNVSFKIYRKTRGHFDYINIIQNLCDCMVKASWLVDDDMNNLKPYFEDWALDKENPRTLISIR